MPDFRYRKIQYYTEAEAENLCDKWNGDNRRANMVASQYTTENLPEGWVINHYVCRDLVASYAKSGRLPSDFEEGYKEGFHHFKKGN